MLLVPKLVQNTGCIQGDLYYFFYTSSNDQITVFMTAKINTRAGIIIIIIMYDTVFIM